MSQQRILLVDDEPDIVSSIRRILRLDGYQIDSAGSLAEMMARTNWPDYFAVLLDRRLQDGFSESVLPELKQAAPDIAIIVITGYADLQGALAALQHGASDYLLKPIDPAHLRSRLQQIAEHRRTRLELDYERRFCKLALDTTQTLILVLNRQLRILKANRRFQDLSGYSHDELAGRHAIELLCPREQQQQVSAHFTAFFDGNGPQGLQQPLKSKSGDVFDIAWWNAPLAETSDQPEELVCAGIDMTPHNRLQQQVVDSARLAAIGEAMAGLAHESRNALQRSQACLDVLGARLTGDEESLDLLAGIQRSQDELHRLYEEVREYAAPVNITPEPCVISDVVRRAWEDVSQLLNGRTAHIVEQGATNALQCKADPFALRQVFRNILENSARSCDGELQIEVKYTVDQQSDCIQIAFRDNGPGIPPENAAKVFDSFFTTRSDGTGLGMAIARRIMQAHRGSISVNTGVSSGAEFIVALPQR